MTNERAVRIGRLLFWFTLAGVVPNVFFAARAVVHGEFVPAAISFAAAVYAARVAGSGELWLRDWEEVLGVSNE